RSGRMDEGFLPTSALVKGTRTLRLVDQSLDLSAVPTALSCHRIEGVVHVQESETTRYQAVSDDPDRADRLLHRDVAAVAGRLEHAKREDSVVAGHEIRGCDAPDVEQLED